MFLEYMLHQIKAPQFYTNYLKLISREGSGRVLDSRPRGCGFEPHRCHCIVVFEQDTFILA